MEVINVQKIKELMIDARLNMIGLSRKSGVCPGALNNILNHGARARLDTVGKIAAALGVPGTELLKAGSF